MVLAADGHINSLVLVCICVFMYAKWSFIVQNHRNISSKTIKIKGTEQMKLYTHKVYFAFIDNKHTHTHNYITLGAHTIFAMLHVGM